MIRQNLFSDAWDGDDEEARTRHRIFWRPDDARMGATLYELSPDAPEDVVAYPEDGYAWVATRDPDPELLARGGDPGIIARFEIPIE